MNAALRALLTGLIDYAGLFPPAKLPMDQAVRNYLRYRDEPEGWMLGRFICPAARLGELAAFEKEIGDRPIAVSALARGGETAADALAGFQCDVEDVRRCEDRGRVTVESFELRVPPDLLRSRERLGLWLVEAALAQKDKEMFVEVPLGAGGLAELLPAIREDGPAWPLGIKLRCGGLDAAAFPSSGAIAEAIAGCLARVLPFKATAGLHHPFPRFDRGVGARMHGFVNLFAAGVFAWKRGAGSADVAAMLDEDDPAAFHFDVDVHWRDLTVSAEEIGQARELFALSFGSCSFDEPRDDLRALGWL
jgi:hypothetical protein